MPLDATAQLGAQLRATLDIQRHDDLEAGAVPAHHGRGALHERREVAHDDGRVIIGRDGALEAATERIGCAQLCLAHVLGRRAAGSGERIARHDRDVVGIAVAEHDVLDGLGADVARGTVAHAVARAQHLADRGLAPAIAVAKTQMRHSFVVDLDHEVAIVRVALEQVRARAPLRARRSRQLHARQGLARILNELVDGGCVVTRVCTSAAALAVLAYAPGVSDLRALQ